MRYGVINNSNGVYIKDIDFRTVKDLINVWKKHGYKKQYVVSLNRKAYIKNTVSDFKSYSIIIMK